MSRFRQSLVCRFLALCMALQLLLAGCSVSPIQLPDPGHAAPLATLDAAADPCHAPQSECSKANYCNPALASSRNAILAAHASERPLSVQSSFAEFANGPGSPPPLFAST